MEQSPFAGLDPSRLSVIAETMAGPSSRGALPITCRITQDTSRAIYWTMVLIGVGQFDRVKAAAEEAAKFPMCGCAWGAWGRTGRFDRL